MNKSIFAIVLLLLTPALASESFSFLSGDMIDYNFGKYDNVSSNNI